MLVVRHWSRRGRRPVGAGILLVLPGVCVSLAVVLLLQRRVHVLRARLLWVSRLLLVIVRLPAAVVLWNSSGKLQTLLPAALTVVGAKTMRLPSQMLILLPLVCCCGGGGENACFGYNHLLRCNIFFDSDTVVPTVQYSCKSSPLKTRKLFWIRTVRTS